MESRGWAECDVIIVTGDAYVDHPSFGAALVGRFLESRGWRVGIIAQPDRDAPGAFTVMGKPRLFWGITAGNIDSQLATLTVMRKPRHDDPYSPDGRAGRRPPNATIVYASAARHAFKDVPIVIGGLEASLRRFAFYDYWTDKVRRSILFDAKADILAYGMAESSVAEIAARLDAGNGISGIAGTADIRRNLDGLDNPLVLPSFESVSARDNSGRKAFSEMARLVHEEHPSRAVVQKHGDRWLVVHPPARPLTQEELDSIYSLPFTRRPHPVYARARIPAYEMIRDSATTHRGCYGDCSFCAITAHQGQTVVSRSMESIVGEVKTMAAMPDFHGTVTDLGGPTANMYCTGCRKGHRHCKGRNCLFPEICPNLETSHEPQIRLLRAVRKIERVRHVFVTSGLRFDLALQGGGNDYVRELVEHHVCGILKIAPEHISSEVLRHMRKPGVSSYRRFVDLFRKITCEAGKKLKIVEYFMSGHPGCTLDDMITLALYLKAARVEPEQVQDFYPAPMSLAAAIFYTGADPMSGEKVYVAKTDREKAFQRAILMCHKPAFHRKAREALRAAGREDLIGNAKSCLVPSGA